MHINCKSSLDISERAQWKALFIGNSFSEIALDWCASLQESKPPGFEIYYLEVYEGETPLAMGVLHILRKIDLAKYIGGTVLKASKALGVIGLRPLQKDVAYLEIPLENLSGILFTASGVSLSEAVSQALVQYIRSNFTFDIFCLKSVTGSPGQESFANLNLPNTEFIANMHLPLKFETFKDYVNSLSANGRSTLRRNRKVFMQRGGIVIRTKDLRSYISEVLRLYTETCKWHAARGDLEVPIQIDEKFFLSLCNEFPDGIELFLSKVDGEVVGFALTLCTTNELHFIMCGVNYAKSEESRAYFNLYYSMIEFAMEKGYKGIHMGAEAYEVKRRVGAQPLPTSYYFTVEIKILKPLVKLLTKNFSNQKGANQKMHA